VQTFDDKKRSTLDAMTSITQAHELTVRLEEYLRAHVPGIGRVVIHVEPNKPAE